MILEMRFQRCMDYRSNSKLPFIFDRPTTRSYMFFIRDLDNISHWGWDKMAAIFQTTYSNAFSWIKMYEFRLRFHWNFFIMFELIIFHRWVQKMAWHQPGDRPLSEPMMVRSLMYICVTQPQWDIQCPYRTASLDAIVVSFLFLRIFYMFI